VKVFFLYLFLAKLVTLYTYLDNCQLRCETVMPIVKFVMALIPLNNDFKFDIQKG